MDKVNLEDSLKATLVELQEYLSLQVKYNKMLLGKKMGEIFSHLALFALVAGISGFLILFLSFAFVVWFNEFTGHHYLGHLVVAGFYLLLILILIIFRNQLIFEPIRKLFGKIMFGDEDDHLEYEEAFKSTEKLNAGIRKVKKAIKKKEKKLGDEYENFSTQFTFTNVLQSIVKNVYTSFVTTSNIAKTVFNLVKRFSKGKKKKIKRDKKYKPPEIEDRTD